MSSPTTGFFFFQEIYSSYETVSIIIMLPILIHLMVMVSNFFSLPKYKNQSWNFTKVMETLNDLKQEEESQRIT